MDNPYTIPAMGEYDPLVRDLCERWAKAIAWNRRQIQQLVRTSPAVAVVGNWFWIGPPSEHYWVQNKDPSIVLQYVPVMELYRLRRAWPDERTLLTFVRNVQYILALCRWIDGGRYPDPPVFTIALSKVREELRAELAFALLKGVP